MAETKTNVMRLLDKQKIKYIPHSYPHGDDIATDGVSVAGFLGKDPSSVYKTLVTRSASKSYYVFVIPVAEHLDLKKAAKAVKEKSIEMIKQNELLPLTGYIHGGCSPIGMKKQFATVLDASAENKETVTVSGGKIGTQVELSPSELLRLTHAKYAEITTKQ